MNYIDHEYLARLLSSLSGIPVRLFRGEELILFSSAISLPRDPMNVYRKEIFGFAEHVAYYITPRFHAYGIVNSGGVRFVIGPTAQIFAEERELNELAFEAGVPKEETRAFIEGMKSIAPMPLEGLITMLIAVNYFLNGEKLELKDVMIREEEQFALKERVEKQRTERTYDTETADFTHNTYKLEELLMGIVQRGDSEALRAWIASAPPVRGGLVASTQLRQLKNTFIVSATLFSRAAISGGLSTETALTMSDAYIRRAELLNSQRDILNLQYNMILEFTEQVEKIRRGGDPTRLVLAVTDYIRKHLSSRIDTDEMAKALFMSRTHLSAQFKKESGETLTDFILREKTEEAKRLLRYSDRSASAVAAYLGFSSHSHFIRVFKKYAGVTPKEWRERIGGS